MIRRIIPVLFLKNGLVVRSENFSIHNVIGNVIHEADRFNQWNVDELIYIDISREKKYDFRRDDHAIKSYHTIDDIISAVSRVCFMPLTFGGGIRTFSEAQKLIRLGADKITLNSALYEDPGLVKKIAKHYGSQCVVASLDYRMIEGQPILHTGFGEKNTGINVYDWIKESHHLGVGEIMLHAIDRDGSADGFDLDTISNVCDSVTLPVIACGGAGTQEDFLDLFSDTNVAAAAAGNIFHFTENSYPGIKKILHEDGYNVRW